MNAEAAAALDIVTSSRLRAWYLAGVKGYAIVEQEEIPRVTRLGRLTYECRWHLRASSKASGKAITE